MCFSHLFSSDLTSIVAINCQCIFKKRLVFNLIKLAQIGNNNSILISSSYLVFLNYFCFNHLGLNTLLRFTIKDKHAFLNCIRAWICFHLFFWLLLSSGYDNLIISSYIMILLYWFTLSCHSWWCHAVIFVISTCWC